MFLSRLLRIFVLVRDVPLTVAYSLMLMIDRFIAYIEAERRYSPLTVRNYRHDIECFAAWWCDHRGRDSFAPSEVEAEDVRERIMQRVAQLKPTSVNRELSSLKSFFRYLRSRGVISSDILFRISALKTPHRLPTFVPETKMECVLDALREQSEGDFREQRNALICSLLYGCGIRLAELCAWDASCVPCAGCPVCETR